MKTTCDVCGKKHFDIRVDKKLEDQFGIKANVCLDCYAWLADYHRYTILLENGLINDKMFSELIKGK